MAESSSGAPVLSSSPHEELAALINRSIELQTESLAVNKRMRELYEQIAQKLSHARDDQGHG